MKSLMFKALLYCNYTSTNLQLYSQSDVIYLARYHTAIPIFHIFNFLSAKSAAKPAPQIYSRKYCSVKRKSPPALRPTALTSFPYFQFFPLFSKKSFPYFGGYQSRLICYLAPPFSKIIYAGAFFIYFSSPRTANYLLTTKHYSLTTANHFSARLIAQMVPYPLPSYYNPYFHARRRRRWQMWLKRDDGVLSVRRGAVKPQMVPYPLPSYCQC